VKTKKAIVVSFATDATNARDGDPTVVYAKPSWRTRLAAWALRGNKALYVRSDDEFRDKFMRES